MNYSAAKVDMVFSVFNFIKDNDMYPFAEVIEVARFPHEHTHTNEALKVVPEKTYPELAENEDERIRKGIVRFISCLNHESYDDFNGVTLDEMLTYLERKKYDRMKPIYDARESFESALEKAWNDYHNGYENVDKLEDDYVECAHAKGFREGYLFGIEKRKEQKCAPQVLPCSAAWFEDGEEKQKEQKSLSTEETELNSIAFLEQLGYTCVPPGAEQKSAEWSDDYRSEDIQTRFAFYTYKDDPSVLYLSNVFVEETSRNHGFGTRILRAAEKVAEAIGAITICLKAKQDSPANAWYRKNGYVYVTFEDGYDWLEKKLEYLKPAKSTEWSEE